MPRQPHACQDCGRPIPADAPMGACPACLVRLAQPALAQEPRRFADYELDERLAEGASSVIYRATYLALNKPVALKIIRTGPFASEDEKRRFRFEAEAAANLHHPGIVEVYEVGEHDHWPFLAMRLVEGPSLAERLRLAKSSPASSFSPVQAASLVAKAARAVHFAHQHGILHRDLKPANILLDEAGEPHLTDFGIAKRLDTADGLTAAHAHLGTPAYMSPEQATGNSGQVTAACDVYSLGVILYEVLCGRLPLLGQSHTETLHATVHHDPPTPRSIRPHLPRDLEVICLKCLEKDPEHRYPSAAALAEDLEHWLRHEPILARRVSAFERAHRWVRRNPLIATLYVLLGLALLGGLAIASWQWRRAEAFLADSRRVNRRLTENLIQSEVRRAESFEGERKEFQTVELLLRLLYEYPDDPLVATRLMSFLGQEIFPWPAAPPLPHPDRLLQVEALPDAKGLVTSCGDGWLRGWNWAEARVGFQLPHAATRGRFALSPTGEALATLASNGFAQVWHLPDGTPLHPHLTSTAPVTAVAFDPTGTLLATGCSDGQIQLWLLTNGVSVATFSHGEPVSHLLFHPRSQCLLSLGATHGAFWPGGPTDAPPPTAGHTASPAPAGSAPSPPTGFRVGPCPEPAWFFPSAAPSQAQFSPEGLRLLTVADRFVEQWDPANGTLLGSYQEGRPINHASFSQDGGWLVATTDRRIIRLISTNSPQPRFHTLNHDGGRVNTARFVSNDRRILTSSDDGTARLFLRDVHLLATQPMPHRAAVLDAFPLPQSNTHVVTVAADHAVRVWSVGQPCTLEPVLPPRAPVPCLAFSEDGALLACATSNQAVALLEACTGRLLTNLAHPAPIVALAFSSDSGHLATADQAGSIRRFAIPSGVPAGGLPPLSLPVRRLLRPANSDLLAVATDEALHLYPAFFTCLSERRLEPVLLSTPLASQAVFSPDGTRLVIPGTNGQLQFHTQAEGWREPRLLDVRGAVGCLQFSADGTILAVGGQQHWAGLWETATLRPFAPPLPHGAPITALAFAPDRTQIMVGCSNGVLSLWTLPPHSTSQPLVAGPDFFRHRGEVRSVQFSPDGQWMLSSGSDGAIRLHQRSGVQAMRLLALSSPATARFSRDGNRLLGLFASGQAVCIQSPAANRPAPATLIALAEMFLGQRFNEQGGWVSLARDEFLARQTVLAQAGYHPGPPPFVTLYR